jgi:hypothetical protein
MKPLWKIKSLLSAMTLAGAVVILTAGASGPKLSPPDAVILNGVTEIFGDKRAFFQTPGLNPSSVQIFSLSEGQSANGIQLLSVNFQRESVMINNHGHVQNIHICSTPALLAAANLGNTGPNAKSKSTTSTKPGAGADSATDNFGTSGDAVSNAGATGLHGGGTAVNPNEKSPNSNGSDSSNPNSSSSVAGNDSPTSSSPASGNGSNSDPTDSHQYVWWYAEAQKIEKTRLETAQRVMAGKWPPEPLTPLTPPGTPAQLIGADSVFLKNGWE